MTSLKRIAALTMVRGDDFYLLKWVEHYGRALGRENLYILFDGTDQSVPSFCDGTNTFLYERKAGSVVEGDKRRIDILSAKASELFSKGYEIVIGTDADEYIVVDPKTGKSLREYLSEAKISPCLSPLGIDLGQVEGVEGDISSDRAFLEQRSRGVLSTRYTKAAIISRPLRWGRGFHRVKGHNFHIAPDLYLFHCGYFDLSRLRERFADPDRRADGWQKHLEKRSRTIRTTTVCRSPKDFDKWTKRARIIQTLVRPPYAWNKPAMFNAKIVVAIPERFKSTL